MRKVTVYIDESGTLPDPKDKVVVVAAVGSEFPQGSDLLFKQLGKSVVFRKPASELKFYTAGEKTKTLFFQALIKGNFSIFILIVEKIGRKIPDTPENYGAICLLLIREILKHFLNIGELIFDRHFSSKDDIDVFNLIIQYIMGKRMTIRHVNSMEDKRVNVADMVAGAVLSKETGKEPRYYEMIASKIVKSKKVKWKEVKRRFLAIKKLA